MEKEKKIYLNSLAEKIDRYYEGSPSILAKDLNNALYMLFHVEREAFNDQAIKDAAFALKNVNGALSQENVTKSNKR